MEKVLIPLESMPSGWSIAPPSEDEDSDDESDECGDSLLTDFEDDDLAEVEYRQGEFGPFLGQAVIQFDSSGEAEAFNKAMSDVFEKCANYESTSEDGTVETITILPLSFDKYGDETLATRVQIDSGGFQLSADLVLIRDDEIVTYLVHGGLGGIDPDLTADFAAEAEQLLDQAT